MELLRWILLGLGLLLIAAIWFQGRRQRAAHTESLLTRARRGWHRRRSRAEERRSAAAPAADEERREPELGDDVAASELDEFLNHERRSAPGFDRPAAAASDEAQQAAADDAIESAESDLTAPTSAADDGGDGAAEAAAAAAASDEPAVAPTPAEQAVDEPEPADTTEPPAGADEEKIIAFFVVAPGGERLSGAELQAAFAAMDLVHGELEIFHRRDDSGRTLFSVANATEPGTFDPATMAEMTTPGVALFARLPGPATPTATFDEIAAATWRLAELLQARPLDSRQSTLSRQTEQAMRDEVLEYQRRRVRRSQ